MRLASSQTLLRRAGSRSFANDPAFVAGLKSWSRAGDCVGLISPRAPAFRKASRKIDNKEPERTHGSRKRVPVHGRGPRLFEPRLVAERTGRFGAPPALQ